MNISELYTRTRSGSLLRSAQKAVRQISALETWAQSMDDLAVQDAFLALANEDENTQIIKGFALVREAARRTLKLRHFDVQLIGGWVLTRGKLAEMKTGEGKTLTITAPAAVLALQGHGVHVVTANSYLASRDAELMRPVYEFLGLTVSAIREDQSKAEKKAAYACDITYGVGSEFGFDYLKDNLAKRPEDRVQRGRFAAIVDEVDSILIDEARVPMIMSGQAPDTSDVVRLLDRAVQGLVADVDFTVDMKERNAQLTDSGYAKVEAALVEVGALKNPRDLYAHDKLPWVRRLHSAVRAYALYRKDRDYVVTNGEIMLVDPGTGRQMEGRRLEDGIHEALEAREGVAIRQGTLTLATVTYQNFFGAYSRLSGLTGTALTEAEEFAEIYNLETVVIPTNKPIQRKQAEDLVFLTKSGKFQAVVQEVKQRQLKGQPVLVGCTSIRDAEALDLLLNRAGVPHETLTAKHIQREAEIIANAGRPGAVTVATNMAGRGTDILLGGEKPAAGASAQEVQEWEARRDAVLKAGGLYVLGTERNGIRRVDNQLAGRSGRQGDPGEVQFYMSLEDELLRVFGTSRQLSLVRRLIENQGGAIGGSTVAKLVDKAQQGFENQGFSARKSLMQLDKALSDQREAVYRLRSHLLEGGALDQLQGWVLSAFEDWLAKNFLDDTDPQQWNVQTLKKDAKDYFGLNLPLLKWTAKGELTPEEIRAQALDLFKAELSKKEWSEEEALDKVLTAVDAGWSDHLAALDELRNNVSLKTKTGFNPIYQFGKDAFELFKSFELNVGYSLAQSCLAGQEQPSNSSVPAVPRELTGAQKVALELEKRWIRRNDSCPCGSGKRFKDCHGRLA